MSSSHPSANETATGDPVMTKPVPLLDVATVVGGGLLSLSGLFRGGLRGWVSTSLGTLLLYRGFMALQEHALRNSEIENDMRSPREDQSRAGRPGTRDQALTASGSSQGKNTCVSPGIVAPM